ncbi:hypothetical protein NOGI109294_24095 [Nocardiopsis gilva]
MPPDRLDDGQVAGHLFTADALHIVQSHSLYLGGR